MNFLNVIKHLLPRGMAWDITQFKYLRLLFDALGLTAADVKTFSDNVYDDVFPGTTRDLVRWEQQFGLDGSGTEDQRRQALAAAWQALGGQSPRYLQDVLQAAGFDVYVFDWWYYSGLTRYTWDPTAIIGFGTPTNTYGNFTYGSGATYGDVEFTSGYVLVNKSGDTVLPTTDPNTWPHYVYVGAAAMPARAQIPAARRTEFETILLRLFPRAKWIGVLVEYT